MKAQLHHGDCRDVLPRLAAEGLRAQTCVTSPPYWGLRDYSLPASPWEAVEFVPTAGLPAITVPAWDGVLGSEPDPWMYVGHMVAIFRLVRACLADGATLWLNLGDCYAANRGYQVPSTKGGPKHSIAQSVGGSGSVVPPGMKPKDLVGIPWMAAKALQADGWWLRSDVIWHKPNAMPSSVTDRLTLAHEYVFLLTNAERYRYDAEAIAEPQGYGGHPLNVNGRPRRSGNAARKYGESADRPGSHLGRGIPWEDKDGLRNKRTVWSIPTAPYHGAHFATFPESLVEPCILAGSQPGGTVLDPFGGSGTTGAVAQRLGRNAVLIEAAEHYLPLIRERTAQSGFLFEGAA